MKRCGYCGEPNEHSLGKCPSAQGNYATGEALLRCRALLRKANAAFALKNIPLQKEIAKELDWPNERELYKHQYTHLVDEFGDPVIVWMNKEDYDNFKQTETDIMSSIRLPKIV